MSRWLTCLIAAFAALRAPAQQIDWTKFFQDLLSRDHAVQNAALERMANDILPKLCSGKPELAAPEIPGLIREMEDSNPQVRVEASALLFTTARFRSDSDNVLAAAIPVFMDHAQHDPESQTRRNCVDALAELKPDIPAEALPLMIDLAEGQNAAVQPGAILGLARMANSHPQVLQVLRKIVSESDSPAAKKAVIQAVPAGGIADTELLLALGRFLSDKNLDLQRAALLAINRCGKQAAVLNRPEIARFAETSSDKDLADLARRLLGRADQQ